MKPYLILFLLVWLIPSEAEAQALRNGFSFELAGGPEAGRWAYHRGLDEDGVPLGFDRSFLSLLGSVEFGVFYHHRNLKTGIQANFRILFEDYLIRSQHTRFDFERYLVTDKKAVRLPSVNLVVAYSLVRYPKFIMRPQVSVGTFFLDTVHPDKENFGFHFVWSGGLENEWTKGRVSVLLQPHYTSYLIFPKENLLKGELNHIYSMGLKVGIRYWLAREKDQ